MTAFNHNVKTVRDKLQLLADSMETRLRNRKSIEHDELEALARDLRGAIDELEKSYNIPAEEKKQRKTKKRTKQSKD